MIKTVVVDANIIIRFLLDDHPKLSLVAKTIFQKAEKGMYKIYLDEVILAEVVWTLSSFYKIQKKDLVDRLQQLVSQDWLVNPKKKLLLMTLDLYLSSNLDYIDCWILNVSKSLGIKLETFDRNLKRFVS